MWADDEHLALCAADDRDVERMDSVVATSLEPPGALSVRDGDTAEEVAEASTGARRLAALQRLRAEALQEQVNIPRAVFLMEKEIADLERGIKSRASGDKELNEVLRRTVEHNRAKEQDARGRFRSA